MIYFDNAATTFTMPAAMKVFEEVTANYGGNPSSLHRLGFEAERQLDGARRTLADAMGVDADELLFTPGGSASDNLAILGFARTLRGGRLITSSYEHPAVRECFKTLEADFDVVYLTPVNGIISPDVLAAQMTPDTRFVSIMHVNNETGAVNPIGELARVAKRVNPAVVFHTDAVQGFMKESFLYRRVDMASFSAHKTHAPRGIGGLYVKKGIRLKPLIYGGGQEKGLCCGTENVAAACAWAEAVRILRENFDADRAQVEKVNDVLRGGLKSLGAEIISPDGASPFILNAVFKGYLSENILHFLSERQIYVSTGSACSSKKPGQVFRALGLQNAAKSALRFSFSHTNTEDQALEVTEAVRAALDSIIKIG